MCCIALRKTAGRRTNGTLRLRKPDWVRCGRDFERNERRSRRNRPMGWPALNKPTHITRGDILDHLEFSKSESSALKIKASIVEAILSEIDSRGLSQREL